MPAADPIAGPGAGGAPVPPRRRRSAWARLRRGLRLRLVIPIRRSPHPPEYTARGVGVALFWAFTPLFPVQTYLLGLTWLAARRARRLDFHPLVAFAWIWVTNALNIVPVYFLFYLTGQVLLGRWDDLAGYAAFAAHWHAAVPDGAGLWDTITAVAGGVLRQQGAALGVGCLPYALGGAWLGYAGTLRVLRRRRPAPNPTANGA
ncbi:MAG: DUF2062 domain-containing protein [Hyphomicrobiales bacterium]|nr:DUF2062 domain-containing protein [Hyphomicrobiales bacterium]